MSTPMFKWFRVDSSNIEMVAYDYGANVLYVRFHTGSVYIYYDVPRDVYTELKNSESVGEYFSEHVRGEYEYERV